ncbi:MAG: hypothetical protein ACRDL2_03245 [Gaiellaceae bacterium]
MRNDKGHVPVRYWLLWWALIAVADFVFYVLLTPIWIGLRVFAWLAEFGRRRRH